MISKVSVFCSSSSLAKEVYRDAARDLATLLVENNILVQYGGGDVGLMGHLADTVIERKGKIRGIIPEFMVKEGWKHHGVKDMEIVETMSERKRIIMTDTDGIITLAGGFGTLEELSEAITLKQLGLINIPIIILNTNGFYDELFNFFRRMSTENLIRDEHHKIWKEVKLPGEVITQLFNTPKWDSGQARKRAAI